MAFQDSEQANSQSSLKTHYEDGLDASSTAFSTFSQEALDFIGQKARSSKYRTRRDEIISRLLCRWWYILPDWPNPHHDYTNELKEAKLKLLTIAEYEEHEDNDANGFTKVYEFSTYKGKSILSVRCF